MSTKKLIGLLSIFLVMGIAFSATNVKAHKPMHLDFLYDADNDILKITVIHGVTDPTIHYISSITIQVNHSTILVTPYTSQPTTNIFTYDITGISAGFNATIDAIASCNIEGSYSKHFNVGWGIGEDKGSFSSIIVPTLMSTILVAIIVMLPGISQKLKKRK